MECAATAETAQPINVNTATVGDLRPMMSLTQAKRLIRYRDEIGGFSSLDALMLVPGFPRDLRRELQLRLTI